MKMEAARQLAEPFTLVNGEIVFPDSVAVGEAVIVRGDKIEAIVPVGRLPKAMARVDVGGRLITAGLIDIHTHGALGHTFNEATAEAFETITVENARRGVTSLLATPATAPIDDLVACLTFARGWMGEPSAGAQVLGVHLEGPYFALEQAGAQDPANLRNPDDGTPDLLLEHADVIEMMSYAPELPGALELTARLDGLGIVPAAGHSMARDSDVQAAMDRGLRHIIHVWSGQSTTVREGLWRKPGLLEASLAFDGLTVEMIADNKHLPATLMKLAYKCVGPDRLCIVSDATSGAGLPEGSRYRMGEMVYEVEGGVGVMLDRSCFAGSTTLLDRMIPVLIDAVGVPLAEAVAMATLNPARVIGIDDRKGSLAPGKDADISIFDDDFIAWRTMIGGRWVFPSNR
ncbi:MAG: N-acetylglucosamine-6-phosphate deacetylase [Chloroflexota bacterium]|nr:N-acetylglucosamine-6-phosphate deacetylase [Chloroflexota bacterium]